MHAHRRLSASSNHAPFPAPTHIKIVDDGIHKPFLEQMAFPLPLTPTHVEKENARNNAKTDESHQEIFFQTMSLLILMSTLWRLLANR